MRAIASVVQRGYLGCSRALGDFRFKDAKICQGEQSNAEVRTTARWQLWLRRTLLSCRSSRRPGRCAAVLSSLREVLAVSLVRSRPCPRSTSPGCNRNLTVLFLLLPPASGVRVPKWGRHCLGMRWSLRCAEQQQGSVLVCELFAVSCRLKQNPSPGGLVPELQAASCKQMQLLQWFKADWPWPAWRA